MARCTCNNPCTCYFEYDGDRPNTNYPQPYQYGRYSTRKTGSGTASNPVVIEFMDSEEFRVEAGQLRASGDYILASATVASFVTGLNTVDYETPNEIFMAYTTHFFTGEIYPSAHRFWYVTAEATFIYNGSASGTRRIHVQWHPPSGTPGDAVTPVYGPMVNMVITGNTVTPLTEDVTLTCSGLIPFVNYADNVNFFGPAGSLQVYVQQDSGSPQTIRNVKVTLVAI